MVSLMAWDNSVPPWKQPKGRDRWLRRDDGSHRRRDRDRRPRRTRTPERRPPRDKGKGGGKCKSKTWTTRSLRERREGGERATSARSSTDVVAVDADPLSHEDALHLWM